MVVAEASQAVVDRLDMRMAFLVRLIRSRHQSEMNWSGLADV